MPTFKSLAAIFLVIAIVAVAAVAAPGTAHAAKTIHVGQTNNNSLADVQEECTEQGGTIFSWYFVINQLGGPKPDTITVVYDNGEEEDVPVIPGVGGRNTAHYQTDEYQDGRTVTDAFALISNDSWTGQFVLSHVDCRIATAIVELTKTFQDGTFTPAPMNGDACFTLTPNPGPDDTEQCTNTPSWSGLTVGSYEITETTTPAGYDPIDPINFIVSLDCSAETPPPVCVEASSDPASFDLGTFEDPLQPGALQVLKQLGTDEGPVAWPDDAPSVTFYICSTGADSTELTIDDCNAGTADVVIAVPDDGNPAESGPLAEGYYTVCEAVPAGYEVDDQCQVVDVVAGDTADANQVTFVNTPALAEWCSPGFWRNQGLDLWEEFYDVLYNDIPNGGDFGDNPTLLEVIQNPQTYGGEATNYVADYLSAQFGLNFTPGEWPDEHNCTLEKA